MLTFHTEMKLAVAATFTNYTTTVIDDENIEETDAYTVKPKGEKLILKIISVCVHALKK